MSKKRRVPLSCLGEPALRQLRKMGFDVDKKVAKERAGQRKHLSGIPFNKYNVASEENRMFEGKKFDSKLEMGFYRWLVTHNYDFEHHPVFEIQPGFVHAGKKIRAIKYEADFLLRSKDGREWIIDAKGLPTREFLLKQKLLLAKGIEIHCIKTLGDLVLFLKEKDVSFTTTAVAGN